MWQQMTTWRSDGNWTEDLGSDDIALRNDALGDLRDMLYRGLSKTLSKGRGVDDAFLDDIVQESSMKILGKLADFQGRSKFRTWAVTIAVRTAISKMRKREWHNVSLDAIIGHANFDPRIAIDGSETTDQTNNRAELLLKLKQLIDSELTDRQWTALTAELAGMPLPQIAEKLGSNTNSLYKLLHDARKRLRRGLEAAGFTVDDVRQAWA
jgi:RNA polymerase sigma-70 factor (ECF subfamily)